MSIRTSTTRALAVAAMGTLGLIAVAPASSADSVWDRVAACESGGNWSINTGNGYYGGLQFHPQTWAGYGGHAYAPNAHLASKSQQIEIARKVLASQGPGAWPTCSVKAGLTRANGGAGSSTPAPAPVTKKETPAPQAAPTPAPAPQSPAKKETPAPQQTQAPAQQSAPAQPTQVRSDLSRYTIVAGDTTGTIAEKHGTTVAELVAINGLGNGGALIFAGDTMLVPGEAASSGVVEVTVAPGDTLAELAQRHGTTVDSLAQANGIGNVDLIIAGDTLRVA